MAWLGDGGAQGGSRQLPVPMFKLLAEREEGALRSLALERAVRAARAEMLGLSRNRDVEPMCDSVISCMKIDEVEDRYLLCGHRDGSISVLDVEDRPHRGHHQFKTVVRIERGVHEFAVTGCAWYPIDTGMFVTSSFDQTVRAWDTNRAHHVHTFRLPEKVYCAAVHSSTAKHCLVAAGCQDDRVYLCDLRTGSRHHSLKGHRGGGVMSVAWKPSEDFVLATGGKDGTLRIWDTRRTKSCLAVLSQEDGPRLQLSGSRRAEGTREDEDSLTPPIAHSGGVDAVMYTKDGRYLISSGHDARMRVWDPDTCEMMIVNYGTFPTRRQLRMLQLSASWNANIIYHPRGNDVIGCDREHISHASIATLPDWQAFWVAGMLHALVAQVETGKRVSILRGHLDGVTCVEVQQKSEQVFSAGHDCNLLVWAPPLTVTGEEDGEEAGGGGDAWSDSDV